MFQSLSGNLRVPARCRGRRENSSFECVSIPFREFEGSGRADLWKSLSVTMFQSLSGNLRVPAIRKGTGGQHGRPVSIPFREFEGSGDLSISFNQCSTSKFQSLSGNLRVPARFQSVPGLPCCWCVSIPFREFEGSGV